MIESSLCYISCLFFFLLTLQGIDGFGIVLNTPSKSQTITSLHQARKSSFLRLYDDDSDYDNDPMNDYSHDEQQYNDKNNGMVKEYLATCIPGLSNVLAMELEQLGATNIEPLGNAAVSFTNSPSNPHVGLRALLWIRTAHQILELIVGEIPNIQTRDDVYEAIRSTVNVKQLLGNGKGGMLTLSSKVILNGRVPKDISHSHYTALTIKNALVDQVRDLRDDNERPNVDTDQADVPLVSIFFGRPERDNTADMTLYRSLHPPGSLHKRGYRAGNAVHKAAMKESLAAGLLLSSKFDEALLHLTQDDGNKNKICLVDPMCGSGSLIIEAAMMVADVAPGLMRIKCGVPGFQMPPVLRWKQDDDDNDITQIWKDMLIDATQRAKEGMRNFQNVDIIANDIHDGALDLLEASLTKAGLSHAVQVSQGDCCDVQFPSKSPSTKSKKEQVWVMTNPPWGVRLSEDDHNSWESLRSFLRETCPKGRTQAWVLSGNKSATKHLGLRRSQSIVIKTGQQDLRWLQYMILEKATIEQEKQLRSNKNDHDDSTNLSTRKKLRVKNRVDRNVNNTSYRTNRQEQEPNKKRHMDDYRQAGDTKKTSTRSLPKSKPKPKPVKVVDDDDSWY